MIQNSPSPLFQKHVVLGITGSIAAYKACQIVRLLVREGAEVQVVITPSGKEFITPLTLATLSQRPVASEFFDRRDGSWHSHVDMGLWADAMLIAPCSAATLGKMVHGIADNLLLTTYLSMKAPVFVAPAMDLDMYVHPSTSANINQLRQWGHTIIEAQSGFLASGLEGKGRMEEPEQIVDTLRQYFASVGGVSPSVSTTTALGEGSANSSKGENSLGRLLITAGPTYERIDPVRFLGNYSSGKMGFALAEAAAAAGWEVDLVAGPVSLQTQHPNIRRINVESAAEMCAAATTAFSTARAAILCAAVADFTPESPATEKLKRESTGEWQLCLKPTEDIAAKLGRSKRHDQRIVGFALETHNELANAQQKMERKQLDMIVLNSLQDEGAGFGVDTNRVAFLTPHRALEQHELMPKTAVAQLIIQRLCELF